MNNNPLPILNLENITKVSEKGALYGFLIFLLSSFFNWALSEYSQSKTEYILAIALFFTIIFYLIFMRNTKLSFLESTIYGIVCSLIYILMVFVIWIPLFGGDLSFYLNHPLHFWTIVGMLGVPVVFGAVINIISGQK